jgi:hypothetical protein
VLPVAGCVLVEFRGLEIKVYFSIKLAALKASGWADTRNIINPPDPHRKNFISFKPFKTFIYTEYVLFSGRSN